METLRVLVVDDSATSRRLLVGLINRDPHLEVVGEATNGNQALKMTERLKPDVITMDIHMPAMDGYETTRRIMEQFPRPIVIVSSDYDPEDVARSFRALEAGALTVLPKPNGYGTEEFAARSSELTEVVRLMAGVKVFRRHSRRRNARQEPVAAPERSLDKTEIIAVGASTGGPAAIASLLKSLPSDLNVPVVIAQHLARGFDRGLVDWLNGVGELKVVLAVHGDRLDPGTVYVAPHGRHLGVTKSGRVSLSDAEPIRGHKPSVTHLFRSVAAVHGAAGLAVIMTGMGDDGVAGLRNFKEAGGRVIAQDEESCVVYGMPRAAVAAGLVDEVLALRDIPDRLRTACSATV